MDKKMSRNLFYFYPNSTQFYKKNKFIIFPLCTLFSPNTTIKKNRTLCYNIPNIKNFYGLICCKSDHSVTLIKKKKILQPYLCGVCFMVRGKG